MELDDEVCLCFHVTRRKLENYLKVTSPVRASQLSDCGGAGTGCGWCVPILEKMFARHVAKHDSSDASELPTAEEHAEKRQQYLRRQNESEVGD